MELIKDNLDHSTKKRQKYEMQIEAAVRHSQAEAWARGPQRGSGHRLPACTPPEASLSQMALTLISVWGTAPFCHFPVRPSQLPTNQPLSSFQNKSDPALSSVTALPPHLSAAVMSMLAASQPRGLTRAHVLCSPSLSALPPPAWSPALQVSPGRQEPLGQSQHAPFQHFSYMVIMCCFKIFKGRTVSACPRPSMWLVLNKCLLNEPPKPISSPVKCQK